MVKPGRAVAGKVLGVGGAVAAVLVAAYVFRNTQAGTKILESLKGAGLVGGQAIIAPVTGLVSGVAAGVGGLTQETAKIGANLASFTEAFQAGDFKSIIDGSYITKYGAPGDQSKPNTQPAPKQQDFTKQTIKDESPNDKSSIKQNFNPPKTSVLSFDLNAYLSRQAQQARITAANIRAKTDKTSTPFGGFANAQQQEAALQAAIAASKRKFPQFFK